MGRYKSSLNGIQNKIKTYCKICSKEFLAYPTQKRKYCSNNCKNKSHLGFTPWNKGKKLPPFTEEWKRNISIGLKGYVPTIEHRRNISIGKTGHITSQETKDKISKSGKGKHPPRKSFVKHTKGYIMVMKPNHPFANNMGYVFEHRLVMEKHIGRFLTPKEIVHHENKILTDNRIENLKLFANNSGHMKYHNLMK